MNKEITIRQWKTELPKIKDVVQLQKHLEEELAKENPRKTLVKDFQDRIELLTIDVKDVAVVKPTITKDKGDENKPTSTTSHTPQIITKTKDIEVVLLTYQKSLEKVDVDSLVWNDVHDKEGYNKIKQTLSALVKLRGSIDSSRKNLNEPLQAVISNNNSKSSELIAEVKHVESILKQRKSDYDDELVRLKRIREEEKAKKALLEQQRKEQLLKAEEEKKNKLINDDAFISKYKNIIDRAKQNASLKEEKEPEVVTSVSKALTDKQIIEEKIKMLNAVISVIQPNTERYIKLSDVIDKNILKIINFAKSNM